MCIYIYIYIYIHLTIHPLSSLHTHTHLPLPPSHALNQSSPTTPLPDHHQPQHHLIHPQQPNRVQLISFFTTSPPSPPSLPPSPTTTITTTTTHAFDSDIPLFLSPQPLTRTTHSPNHPITNTTPPIYLLFSLTFSRYTLYFSPPTSPRRDPHDHHPLYDDLN